LPAPGSPFLSDEATPVHNHPFWQNGTIISDQK
jgi:hypothetical protein